MKIVAVFKTHFDIGFTELSKDIVQRYGGKMLDDVLSTCEGTQRLGKGRQYVWTMASWPLKVTLQSAPPDKRERAVALLKNGQLCTHGLPFTTHTEFLSPDELDFGCGIAKELCAQFGLRAPVSAKMTDVPGHAMGLVEVLARNGIRFLHLGCNPASTPPDVPTLFWWQDKKGNRVLTMYNKTYGSSVNPPKDWKYPVYLAMQQTNDNVGPQGPEVIEQLAAQVTEGSELFVGTMDDFYNEIVKCDLSGLPVVQGDLGDTWIHGVGTYPKEVSDIRRARALMQLCREQAKKTKADISRCEKQYYENVLLFGEHTWGLDVKTHLGWNRAYDKAGFLAQSAEPRYKLMEQSWDEQRERANSAVRAAQEAAQILGIRPQAAPPCFNPLYKIEQKDGLPVVVLPNGKRVSVRYDYKHIATDDMHRFMKSYITRLYGWAIADFGRESYPETEEQSFTGELIKTEERPFGKRFYYRNAAKSYEEQGNCASYCVELYTAADGVHVRLELLDKQASPYLETGDLFFDTDCAGQSYGFDRCGVEIDPFKDIVPDANSVLFCVQSYASIDNVKIQTTDFPLVAFGTSAVFKSNIGNFQAPEKPSVVFNLFNNMWGTNFPQWTSGDVCGEWVVSEKG